MPDYRELTPEQVRDAMIEKARTYPAGAGFRWLDEPPAGMDPRSTDYNEVHAIEMYMRQGRAYDPSKLDFLWKHG